MQLHYCFKANGHTPDHFSTIISNSYEKKSILPDGHWKNMPNESSSYWKGCLTKSSSSLWKTDTRELIQDVLFWNTQILSAVPSSDFLTRSNRSAQLETLWARGFIKKRFGKNLQWGRALWCFADESKMCRRALCVKRRITLTGQCGLVNSWNALSLKPLDF